MLLRQPIMQGGRQEQRLVHIRGAKALSHDRILSPNTLWKSCYVWYFGRIYSRQTPRRRRIVWQRGAGRKRKGLRRNRRRTVSVSERWSRVREHALKNVASLCMLSKQEAIHWTCCRHIGLVPSGSAIWKVGGERGPGSVLGSRPVFTNVCAPAGKWSLRKVT